MADKVSLAQALGVTHDPFAHPAETFFAAGDRTRQLDELRQLSRGTRRLLVVTGEQGVGKSVMFRTLSNRLDPGVKAARINASLVNDLMGMLTGVLQGLGVSQPERNKADALAAAIVTHARQQGEASRYDLVMVDDAHALELRALETLLRMLVATPQRGLRIVFFAESRFVRSLEKAVARVAPGLTWHEIRLTPFSRDEVRRYLKFRFAEAGWDDHVPFTESQIQELVADAGGLPGELDRCASELLKRPVDGGGAGFLPPLHRAALLLLAVVVGMAWLVWSYEPEAPPPAEVAVAPPEPAVVPPKPVPEKDVKATPATPAPGPIEEPPDRQAEAPPEEGVDRIAAARAESAPSVVAQPEADAPAEPATGTVVREPRAALASEPEPEREGEPEAVNPEPPQAPVADAPAAPPQPTVAISQPERAPPAQPVDRAPERALPLDETPVQAPEPEPQRPVLRVGAKGAAWVMRQAPERYTLQLFGSSNRDRLVAYVNRQQDISEFALVPLERDGEPWYVITYGVFSSEDAAQVAAGNLPDAMGRVDPWVRQFSAVQAHLHRSAR